MSEDGRPTSPWSGQATMNSLQAPDAPCLPLRGSVSHSREMRGSRVRGYNVSTSADRGHGSSEAGQNRQLERGPSRQADA